MYVLFNGKVNELIGTKIKFELRINFYLLRTFSPHLGSFFCVCVLFLLSLRFGQIPPLAFFRWFTATSDRNAESCNRIPSNYGPRRAFKDGFFGLINPYLVFQSRVRTEFLYLSLIGAADRSVESLRFQVSIVRR